MCKAGAQLEVANVADLSALKISICMRCNHKIACAVYSACYLHFELDGNYSSHLYLASNHFIIFIINNSSKILRFTFSLNTPNCKLNRLFQFQLSGCNFIGSVQLLLCDQMTQEIYGFYM